MHHCTALHFGKLIFIDQDVIFNKFFMFRSELCSIGENTEDSIY